MKKLVFTAFAVGLGITANVMTQVPSYVPSNGLVGWWPFNGNANDESGNGNNGTVNGTTLTTDRFGNAGKAYSFDGVDDRIEVNNSSSLNPTSISISGWINSQTNATNVQNGAKGIVTKWYQQINCNNNGDNYNIQLSYVNNQSVLLGSTMVNNQVTGALTTDTNIIGIGNWKHFVFIQNNLGRFIYINGVLINSNNQFGNLCPTLNKLYFGADNNLGTLWRFFQGKLDDIGIWNRALTDQEISDLYNANICYDYVTVTDTLIINTGITGYNPITYLNTLKIWPNPSNDHITIDAGNLATMNGYSIKIEDAQGQQVFQNAVNQQQFYIDITTWGGNGLYFVRIIDPQGNTVDIKKIVLQ
jgi:hypothetical protein